MILESPSIIKDPTALADGYSVIISVEAIRNRTEQRWSQKEETVWEFAQRQFDRSFSKADALRKINDVEYLIIMADLVGAAAQFRAIDFLRSILVFFLGMADLAEVKLSIVRSIRDGVIEADPLSYDDIRAIVTGGSARPTAQPDEQLHPPCALDIAVVGDRAYQVLVSVDPVWNINKQAIGSYNLQPIIFSAATNCRDVVSDDELSLRDLFEIDMAILKNAVEEIRQGQAAGDIFALHVPIHFRCLRSPSCRAGLARLLPPMIRDIRKFLVFCIVGVPDGAPKSLLTDAISALRAHGVGVLMTPAQLNGEVRRWQGLGLSGVVVDFANECQTGAEIIAKTAEFGAACAGVTASLIGLSIATRPLLLAAWNAGFTHISGSPVSEKAPKGRAAVRFTAASLYAERKGGAGALNTASG